MVNGWGLCLKDASDRLAQDATPPINEVNSGSRGLLILHGCIRCDTSNVLC